MSKKAIERKIGDFLKIPLSDGSYGYARVLQNPLIAVYDVKSKNSLCLNEIAKKKVLFKVCVMNHAIKKGIWPIIGHRPLDAELEKIVKFYKVDKISNEITIYWEKGNDYFEEPANFKECKNLEVAAVWEPEHIVERIEDHYAGRKNQFVENSKNELKQAGENGAG